VDLAYRPRSLPLNLSRSMDTEIEGLEREDTWFEYVFGGWDPATNLRSAL
jgi:hypothetical protein